MTTSSLGPRPARFRSTLIAAALLAVAVSVAPAPGRAASQQDEDACRPDVFRLCASAIPSEDAIVACLNAKLPGLSPACRAVMAPAPPPTATPRRPRTATP